VDRKSTDYDAGDITPESMSARTRARVLDAAAFVLGRKGYAGTRLTDVAEHAGLRAPAIYYYFPRRGDLIEEVMWAGIADLRAHVDGILEALPATTGPLEHIDAAVEAHLRHALEISDCTTAAIRNTGQVPEHICARQIAEQAKYGATWRLLLEAVSDAGLLRAELDVRSARMLILGALNWASEWCNPRRGSLDAVVRTAQVMVRNALSAAPNGGRRIDGGRVGPEELNLI
jgi:AcrR family transcriptional regulator